MPLLPPYLAQGPNPLFWGPNLLLLEKLQPARSLCRWPLPSFPSGLGSWVSQYLHSKTPLVEVFPYT